ncbi:restriction endonuclease subunit S [Xenorhabdus bovienii]|uniref:restriction endonuclease subunit S n=1 Tax=Xenorhabdus bovienii TaxID=40576 RepID=UPI001EDEB7EE|nr:restriction endonuclease subunit S [Xenorhabdus bovienii]MCG3460690.1 restriction endonuclease subunit S [Xenorhabdus bovienii]
MSNMSFMEKLLDGVEVEWKSLGEVGEFIRGNGMQKKDFIETGFPAIHYGQIYTRYGLSADKTFTYISEDLANKLRKANKNDLLLATTSENDEDVVKPLAWLGGEAVISGDMMLFRHDQNVKYLAYYFQTEAFQTQKRKYINGAKVRRVSKDDLAKIVVPIPKKLDIQTEIVRILDVFTELTAELTAGLTAELTARKKQYNYYRDQLLSFEESEVEWKTLGEIATIGTGSRNTNEAVLDGQYPFFVRSQEPRAIDSFEFDETAIITAGDGVGVGKVFHYVSGKYALHQRAYRIVVRDDHVNSKFLFYYIRNNFARYLTKISVHASVTSLRKPMFEKYPIPILPLAEQGRIVTILDKFDTLTSSISEGLPREIELRQKQYEYYRNLLLSFPKPEVEA